MKTQYLIGHEKPEKKGYLYQQEDNADVLIGLLDLPTSMISEPEIEFYLKCMALFYDRLFIPDGWLHCDGPIYRYLNSLFQKSKSVTSKEFAGNTFSRLLDCGIIVPLLRGERPKFPEDEARGFDLFEVWSGKSCNQNGTRLEKGVYFEDPSRRMMILDSEEKDHKINREIIESLSRGIKVFSDWTIPNAPIDKPLSHESSVVNAWNKEFSERIYELLLESEIGLNLLELDPYIWLDVIRDRQTKKVAEGFIKEMKDRIKSLKSEKTDLRRGTIEHQVAEYLRLGRLQNYGELIKNDLNIETLLARNMLNKVSTVQELMFANKLKCSPGFPNNFSVDVLSRLTDPSFGLLDSLETLRESNSTLAKNSVNIAALEVDQINALRKRNQDYFVALGKMRKEGDLGEAYRQFYDAATIYAQDIEKVAPLGGLASSIPNAAASLGLSGIVAGISLSVTSVGIAILVGSVSIPVIFMAKPLLLAGKSFLQPKVAKQLDDKVKRAYESKRTDAIRMLLGADYGTYTITRSTG